MFLAVLLLASMGDVKLTPEQRGAIALEQRAVDQRKELVRGKVDLRSIYWASQTPGGPQIKANCNLTLFFDGTKARVDKEFVSLRDAREVSTRIVTCNTKTDSIRFRIDSEQDPSTMQGSIQDRMSLMEWKTLPPIANGEALLIDARVLGLLPSATAMTVNSPIDKFVGATKYLDIQVENATLHKIACKKITKTYENKVTSIVWIAPSQGDGVLRVEVQHGAANVAFVTSVESTLKYDKVAKLWFPSYYEIRSTLDGVLMELEKVTVKSSRLNQKLDPTRFTLLDMNIPVGTGFMVNKKNQPKTVNTYVWNGIELVPKPSR